MLDMVYKHSCKWRYHFNPKKSAILVYGESKSEQKLNSKYRIFRLGQDRIKEQISYDHLGLKNSTDISSSERTEEKIKKGRKALNAAAGLGLKPGGLTINACSILYWAMIVPIVTFASELWVLKDEDIKQLESFQRYSGRRIQRFNMRSPNETSYTALGWLRLEIFIYLKKVLFVRSIAVMEDDSVYKQVFRQRLIQYNVNPPESNANRCDSPIYDIINATILFGLYDDAVGMILGTKMFSKHQWKLKVWDNAWYIEKQDWSIRSELFSVTKLLKNVLVPGIPLVWWQMANAMPEKMRHFETMVKLVCMSSDLKSDSYVFRNDARQDIKCDLCDTHSTENANHIIMHCPFFNNDRADLFNSISALETDLNVTFITNQCNVFHALMGKRVDNIDPRIHMHFLSLVASRIHTVYTKVIQLRKGIG